MRLLLAVMSFSVVALQVSDAAAQKVPANMVALQAEIETVYNLLTGQRFGRLGTSIGVRPARFEKIRRWARSLPTSLPERSRFSSPKRKRRE